MLINFAKRTFPVIRFFSYLLLIYLLGIVKGILLGIVIHKLYHYVILKLYKLQAFSPGDLLFVFNPKEDNYNCLCYLNFDEMDVEALKNNFIERGMKRFAKLRSIQKYKFFDFWWYELSLEECLTKYNPIEVHYNKVKFDSVDDIIKQSAEEHAEHIDVENSLPYKIKIYKNDEGIYKNLVLLKFDHSLSDGIGFIAIISSLADNYNLQLFPPTMRKGNLPFISKVLTLLKLPINLPYIFYSNLYSLKSGPTPFKSIKTRKGSAKTAISTHYDFNEFAKINKKLGITFNDMIMTVFSAAIKKYCKLHYSVVPEKIITVTPISTRALNENPSHNLITNDSTGVTNELRLIDDPLTEYKTISKEYSKNVRNLSMIRAMQLTIDFLNVYMPYYVGKWVYKTSSKKIDITFSNVALSREQLKYGDSKLCELFPLVTPGYTHSFVAIFSYNGKFRYTISVDEALDIDPKVLEKYAHEYFELMKSSYEEKTLIEKKLD